MNRTEQGTVVSKKDGFYVISTRDIDNNIRYFRISNGNGKFNVMDKVQIFIDKDDVFECDVNGDPIREEEVKYYTKLPYLLTKDNDVYRWSNEKHLVENILNKCLESNSLSGVRVFKEIDFTIKKCVKIEDE